MAVGFSPTAMGQLGKCCKDFELIQIGGMRQLDQVMSRDVTESVDLIAVSAIDSEDSTHLHEISSFRKDTVKARIPILSAISRYQMSLGKELDQLERSAWVFQPLNKTELEECLVALNV